MQGISDALVMAGLQSVKLQLKYTECYLCSSSHLHSKGNGQREAAGRGRETGRGREGERDDDTGRMRGIKCHSWG